MQMRWGFLLIPPLVVSTFLLMATQIIFLQASFHADLGLGISGKDFVLSNYIEVFTDSFYLRALWDTIYISLYVVVFSLALGYPVAYVLARMPSRWAAILLASVVISSFITIVIKVLGLIIIFSYNGPLNSLLVWLNVIDSPISIMGTRHGVVIGLLHYTLGFTVLVLFSVIQTIPRSLEEAGQIHGASRLRVFQRIIIPLSLPGVIGASLIIFNLSMGAFTSAALLGGGRVLTIPVLIHRTIVFELKYGTAATLSAILLVSVLLINLVSIFIVTRMKRYRGKVL